MYTYACIRNLPLAHIPLWYYRSKFIKVTIHLEDSDGMHTSPALHDNNVLLHEGGIDQHSALPGSRVISF
jgi:hypothetical protein